MVDKIKDKAINSEIPEFEEIFKRKYDPNLNFEELLEKMVILTHIVSREFQLYIDHGNCETFLEEMWNGQFKHESNLEERFYQKNLPYR